MNGPSLPNNYVPLVDSNDSEVDQLPPHQQIHSSHSRPSSSSTERNSLTRQKSLQRSNCSIKTSCSYRSQSTVNTLCSRHTKSRHNSISNTSRRSVSSDPNQPLATENLEYFVNSGQTHLHQHSNRSHHPQHALLNRRQSQQESIVHSSLSRNSSVKSTQSFNNPEYFYGSNNALNRCSCTNSKSSLNIKTASTSREHLMASVEDQQQKNINEIEELYHYTRIDRPPRKLSTPPPPLPHKQNELLIKQLTSMEPDHESSSYADSSTTLTSDQPPARVTNGIPNGIPREEELYNTTTTISENSYASINQPGPAKRSQSIYNSPYDYKHYDGTVAGPRPSTSKASSLKVLTPSKFTVESYTLPLHRRHRSCGSTDSFDDISIPEYFHSPSRIKWNFLTGLPDRSRSQSQVGSRSSNNEFKTDNEEDIEDAMAKEKKQHVCKIDEILRKESSPFSPDSSSQPSRSRDKTVSIWRTNGGDDCNAMIFHHDSEVVENCCKSYFPVDESSATTSLSGCKEKEESHSQEVSCHDENCQILCHCDGEECEGLYTGSCPSDCSYNKHEKEESKEDNEVYEFELCTKENCEYLLQSSSQLPQPSSPSPQLPFLNNQIDKEYLSNISKNKSISMKHNKLKPSKRSIKKGSISTSASMSSLKNDEFLMLNQLNFANFIKKDSKNTNHNVNLKKTSNSSSMTSLNTHSNNNNVNHNSRNKLEHPQQPLNIRSLLLASSTTSARSAAYTNLSIPNLAEQPSSSHTTELASTVHNVISTNFSNGCQFINNDITNSSNLSNSNSNDHSSFHHSIINSNDSNYNDIMERPRSRRRYDPLNMNGIIRGARKRARKYVNSFWPKEEDHQ